LKVTRSASPGSVRVQVTYLKEKLKELGLRIEILTVHGYGYKMVCNEEFFVISDKLVVISRHVLLTTGTFEEDVGRASNSE
jgi:hypothetical protein